MGNPTKEIRMKIHEFADQLKKTDGLSPLLQALQALRRCSLDQLQADDDPVPGWNPWMDEGVESRQALAHS